MDIRQLTYFVAVAEEQQFTRASVRLSIAQPAVSHQIRRLELELGERLFHREQRSVRLTEAGRELLPHARAAIAAVESGRGAVASLHGLLRGTLRIGLVRAPLDRAIFEALGDFHRTWPDVELVLSEEHNAQLLADLAAGEIDVAIIGRTAEPLPPGLQARVIAHEPLVLAVPTDHLLARRARAHLDELRDAPLVTLTRGSGLRYVLERACREAGFVPRIVAEATDLRSLTALVGEGFGVAVLPSSAITGRDGRVVALDLTRPRLKRRTAIAWRRNSLSPAGRAFLTHSAAQSPRGDARTDSQAKRDASGDSASGVP